MSTDDRGHPAESQAVALDDIGRALLAQARDARHGHASQLLIGGEHQRAVLMALVGGATLSDHESPPAATFHVLSGSARLSGVGGAGWTVHAGQLLAVPPERHGVVALEDCVILLTVGLGPRPLN